MQVSEMSLVQKYEAIKKNISRHLEFKQKQVVLVAASKTQSIETIEELYQLGHRDFGENYVQELLEKAPELEKRGYRDIRWHFIGHLQTNKVKQLVPFVSCVHTIDSLKLARELSKRWCELGRSMKLPVFIEVNVDEEVSKAGILPAVVREFADSLKNIPNLQIQGLMCIPQYEKDPSESFMALRKLEEDCRPVTQGMLSMGMSNDYEIALQEGATHIRLGTSLFGVRKKKAKE
jgi:pyridoxal phosphate enzyme (YggS family)